MVAGSSRGAGDASPGVWDVGDTSMARSSNAPTADTSWADEVAEAEDAGSLWTPPHLPRSNPMGDESAELADDGLDPWGCEAEDSALSPDTRGGFAWYTR